MKKITLLFLVIFSFLHFSLTSVNNEVSYFVQFKIFNVSDNDAAQMIDKKMAAKSGIKISRTDYITSTYYGVLNPGVDYSQEQFENWFKKLGYSIGCFKKGIHRQDQTTSPHLLKNCSDEK
ncbi:MAG: hypothetical protein ACWA41_07525 [Putridiphycobacter sp.]